MFLQKTKVAFTKEFEEIVRYAEQEGFLDIAAVSYGATPDWTQAIWAMPAKTVRSMKGGFYNVSFGIDGKYVLNATKKKVPVRVSCISEVEVGEVQYMIRVLRFLCTLREKGVSDKDVRVSHEKYAVARSGEVFSLETGHAMVVYDSGHGGYCINVHSNCNHSVAKMIVEAFIGPVNANQVVKHKDGHNDNNALDNLYIHTLGTKDEYAEYRAECLAKENETGDSE